MVKTESHAMHHAGSTVVILAMVDGLYACKHKSLMCHLLSATNHEHEELHERHRAKKW